MRQLLKNAKIYDGTGSEPYMGDILIEGDRIAKIAPAIDLPADSVMDLKGLSVSSGFIDGQLVLSHGQLAEDTLKTSGRALPV